MSLEIEKKVKSTTLAEKADRYELYLEAIQEPKDVVAFLNKNYRDKFSRIPTIIREDFCGTASNCIEWLKANPSGKAIGVDIDPEPLAWAKKKLVPGMSRHQQDRLTLIEGDSKKAHTEKVDAILGLNSSICYFKSRPELMTYFRNCHHYLGKDGLLMLEVYGGPESQTSGKDRTKFDHFIIEWEQASFNTITQESENYIHFEFPDGSRMENAFSYDFRLWSIAEITDGLNEAGFSQWEVYCIKDDSFTKWPDPETPLTEVEIRDSWTAYVVAF